LPAAGRQSYFIFVNNIFDKTSLLLMAGQGPVSPLAAVQDLASGLGLAAKPLGNFLP
jgi:hypothetical protein